MPHFPMFVDLSGRPVLIVGGGSVALRKLRKLAPYGPRYAAAPFPPMIWNRDPRWS